MVNRLPVILPLPDRFDLSEFSASTTDFNKIARRIRGQIAGPVLCNLKTGHEASDIKLTRDMSAIYGLERFLRGQGIAEDINSKTLQVMADLEVMMGDLAVPKDALGLALDKPVKVDFRDVYIDKLGKSLFAKKIAQAFKENIPLQMVSTVCPGYTYSSEGVYDFKGFTDDAGLLGKIHLTCFRELFQPVLQRYDVPYQYQVIVADLSEGFDDDVVRKFAGGDPKRFLEVAQGTVRALDNFAQSLGIHNMTVTTMGNFFQVSYEDYKREREAMIDKIVDLAGRNEAFGYTFKGYLEPRRALYTRFVASEEHTLSETLLKRRAANGFAQYFHHFDLLRAHLPEAVVINHRTNSLRFINGGLIEGNEGLVFAEDVSHHGKIKLPIIVLDTEVY